MASKSSPKANPRITGTCAVCGEQLYEVLQKWPRDHPMAGEPMRLGKLEALDAVRSHVILIDGSQAMLTTCAVCVAVLDGNLVAVWRTVWASHLRERTLWWALGAKPFTPAQTKHAYTDSAKLYDNVPLGTLYREVLAEVLDGRSTTT